MSDRQALQRFIDAQDDRRTYMSARGAAHGSQTVALDVVRVPAAGRPGAQPDVAALRDRVAVFARARPETTVFQEVLNAYFDGVPDEATESLLR